MSKNNISDCNIKELSADPAVRAAEPFYPFQRHNCRRLRLYKPLLAGIIGKIWMLDHFTRCCVSLFITFFHVWVAVTAGNITSFLSIDMFEILLSNGAFAANCISLKCVLRRDIIKRGEIEFYIVTRRCRRQSIRNICSAAEKQDYTARKWKILIPILDINIWTALKFVLQCASLQWRTNLGVGRKHQNVYFLVCSSTFNGSSRFNNSERVVELTHPISRSGEPQPFLFYLLPDTFPVCAACSINFYSASIAFNISVIIAPPDAGSRSFYFSELLCWFDSARRQYTSLRN